MSITRETEIYEESPQEVVLEEIQEGDIFFSIYSYTAEAEQAIDLVEGERVYVLETPNTDWWYIKKHLTEEKGWVPAQLLMNESNYTIYVQKRLNEKIDKLPVFESKFILPPNRAIVTLAFSEPKPEEKSVAPKFIEKLQPQHTQDGYTVQFECQVEGIPRPQITWFRQTAIIKPSQDFQMYYDDDNVATLIIREVFPEDAGTFTCVAKNAAGFASSTTELIVEAPLSDHGSDIMGLSRKSMSRESSLADILEGIPPTFSRKPKAECVTEGDDVTVECHLVAVPEPDVLWYHNGRIIQKTSNSVVSVTSDMHMYSTQLKITKIKKSQEGSYKIVAKNREGEATVEFTLKVKTGDKEPPQILEPLQPVTVKEGDSTTLTATIFGNPAPTITWLKNGKPISKPNSKVIDNTYTLSFENVQTDYSGEYTIKATNEHGTAETTAQLIVEGKLCFWNICASAFNIAGVWIFCNIFVVNRFCLILLLFIALPCFSRFVSCCP